MTTNNRHPNMPAFVMVVAQVDAWRETSKTLPGSNHDAVSLLNNGLSRYVGGTAESSIRVEEELDRLRAGLVLLSVRASTGNGVKYWKSVCREQVFDGEY